MKSFYFPLARVLEWRRTQVRLEEAKLERAHSEVRKIECRIEEVHAAETSSERALLAPGGATGAELMAFASFKKFVAAESAKLRQAADLARTRAVTQMQALAKARQEARLLEKLEQRELSDWNAAFSRELEAEAEEAHIAKMATLRREQDLPGG